MDADERVALFAEWKAMTEGEKRALFEWWCASPKRTPEWPFGLFAMSTSTIVSALRDNKEGRA